jgi:hypothetical protein
LSPLLNRLADQVRLAHLRRDLRQLATPNPETLPVKDEDCQDWGIPGQRSRTSLNTKLAPELHRRGDQGDGTVVLDVWKILRRDARSA